MIEFRGYAEIASTDTQPKATDIHSTDLCIKMVPGSMTLMLHSPCCFVQEA